MEPEKIVTPAPVKRSGVELALLAFVLVISFAGAIYAMWSGVHLLVYGFGR